MIYKKLGPKQIFGAINSCIEFNDYLKELAKMKKLSIIKIDEKLIIKFIVEYLLKKYTIEIELLLEKKNNVFNLVENLGNELLLIKKENKEIKKEIEDLKNENKELKKEINNLIYENKNNIEKQNKENEILKKNIEKQFQEIEDLKKENNNFKEKIININEKLDNNFYENSVIMKEIEFNLIESAIEERINKKIKSLKKIYQATIHGGDISNFHSKCDMIPNTLVIIKSSGNKRFGGFTSECWESPSHYKWKNDKNAFLFSLDKKKFIHINIIIRQFIVIKILELFLEVDQIYI